MDVDFDRWTLRFLHTKIAQPRFVPLVGPAQAALVPISNATR
jgi:hypothetical protein